MVVKTRSAARPSKEDANADQRHFTATQSTARGTRSRKPLIDAMRATQFQDSIKPPAA
jgi:hypothetical protein